ncbi:AI-2E family transporter [Lignipirellula cremea]|uniref:Putative inner membrane protein n=1 Tax=Lignipirellula cremea TaxID=2528010 RepID=A0A518DYZ3_9BACT|nr:AI-2E family transporter [Lignipirellula cremea]QDU97025.1 putative inner membrane protein [Lignipirellula cremea]
MSRLVSFVVLIAVILVVGFVVYRVLAKFMPPLFLACLLVVMFRPVYLWILQRVGGRSRVAAALTTIGVTLAVLLPAMGVFTIAAIEGLDLVARVKVSSVRPQLARLRKNAGLELPGAEELRRIEGSLAELMEAGQRGELMVDQRMVVENDLQRVMRVEASLIASGQFDDATARKMVEPLEKALGEVASVKPDTLATETAIQKVQNLIRDLKIDVLGSGFMVWAADLANPSDERLGEVNAAVVGWAQRSAPKATSVTLGVVASYIIGLIVMVVSIFFFFADGPKMINAMMNLFPLDNRYEQELLLEFDNVSRAVVLSHLVSALAQALLAGIAFYFAGLNAVFLLMLLTFTLAMVPFVGAASVWAPCALYLFFIEERFWPAVLLAIWGAVVVSCIDNVIKPYILHGRSKLHPLLALLSVLGGVQALGPIGILIGPMVVVFLSTLLKILHREMLHLEGEPIASLFRSAQDPAAPGTTEV